jgi:hypothetical protein
MSYIVTMFYGILHSNSTVRRKGWVRLLRCSKDGNLNKYGKEKREKTPTPYPLPRKEKKNHPHHDTHMANEKPRDTVMANSQLETPRDTPQWPIKITRQLKCY